MAKKLYVIHYDILPEVDGCYNDMTDEEMADIIKKDYNDGGFYTQCFDSMEQVATAWNADTLFSVDFSYMRVMDEVKQDPNIKRTDEFGQRMDALLKEFSDVPCSELADSLDYYASDMQAKANRE